MIENLKSLPQEILKNTFKRYIAISIVSTLVVVPIIVVVCVGEPDYVRATYNPYCSKPYNIKIYSNKTISSKLEECGYKKNTDFFNFLLEAVNTHNLLRACHNAQPLMPNCEIMKISQDYAETMPSGHSSTTYHGKWMGENLFWSWGMKLNGAFPVKDWYDEISNYDFKTHSSKGGVTGHFTQVVWKASSEVGIGYYCQGTSCCVVGNYYPGGNYGNLYSTNVQDFR